MRRLLASSLLVAFAVACGDGGPSGKPDGGSVEETPDASNPTPDAGPPDAGPETPDAGTTDGGTQIRFELTRVTPPRGPLGGDTIVVLNGRGFVEGFAFSGGQEANDATQITFGSNPAIEIEVIDDDTIEVTSPPGTAGAVDITLTNPNGTLTCDDCFTYYEPIELDRVTPSSGSTRGGDRITLDGKGFVPGILVLVGGNAATDLQLAPNGLSLTARTPPGVAGTADVGVVGTNSAAFLRRSFLFVAPMAVTAVEPPASPLAGGVEVTITGAAFTSDARVTFGGVAAASVQFVSDTELVAVAPASGTAGAVDVTVTGRRGTATLERAFAFYDEARDLQLYAVSPRRGPVSGGTCAQGAATCLVLTGAGLDAGDLSVKVGGRDGTVRVVDGNHAEVDLPPGTPGIVDIQARTVRGGARLDGAFAYVRPLELTAITPASAPASGAPAVEATLSGVGFGEECKVYFGASEGTVASVSGDGTQLVVTVPPGPAGKRDVRVSCGDPGAIDLREAVLTNGFDFTAPLELLQLDPDNGSIAGNTAVSLYGNGFRPGMVVTFGTRSATVVDVKSPHLAVLRTPRGDVGLVDVKVANGFSASHTLKAAYGYTDPTRTIGGGSGGPMRGILNVTVLNSTPGMSGPVPGVTIAINADQLVGVTDDRGQVTFSDPTLLKPVSITGSKTGFAAATIARIDARNVTLLMQMNEGDGEPSQPPPPPEPAVLTGRVCGFKTPPGFKLEQGERLEARVFMTARYVYAAPPFANPATPTTVATDCGTYTVATRRYGALALYAIFGVSNPSAQTFRPMLMGIRRAIDAAPGRKDEKLDIVLDMHRDVSIPIHVDAAQPPPGRTAINMVYSYLDLGGEGVVPLAETASEQNDFLFTEHPRVSGEGLIFLNFAALLDPITLDAVPPYSFYYRRQYGDPSAGVEVGPMLAFTQLETPLEGGVFTGNLGWSFSGGQRPDLQQHFVEAPAGIMTKPIWDLILPGSELGVALPPSALSSIPSGSTLYWTVITARTPRFDYDRFGYQQLGLNVWTSFTQDFTYFVSP